VVNIVIWAHKSWTSFESSIKAVAEEIRQDLLAEEAAAAPVNNLRPLKH
jgi:hypothetical protein